MLFAKNVQAGDKELILCEGTGTSSDKPTSVRVRNIRRFLMLVSSSQLET